MLPMEAVSPWSSWQSTASGPASTMPQQSGSVASSSVIVRSAEPLQPRSLVTVYVYTPAGLVVGSKMAGTGWPLYTHVPPALGVPPSMVTMSNDGGYMHTLMAVSWPGFTPGSRLIVISSVSEHSGCPVTYAVSVYVVVLSGNALGFAVLGLERPSGGDQV